MKIDRQDIVLAAENIDLNEDDYSIRESYEGRYGVHGVGVDLPDHGKATELMVALAVQMAEDGQGEDALCLARLMRTDSRGFSVVVYWNGTELTG